MNIAPQIAPWVLGFVLVVASQVAVGEAEVVARFRFQDVAGVGHEPGVCRRDPSDVIKVGSTWYVWYSKVTRDQPLYPSGYKATVWYATSTDAGRTWVEHGEAVGIGESGFDAEAVFTPNILVAGGTYYLAYTAVAQGFTNTSYTEANRTAIGMAVAESPDGPWGKLETNPILVSSREPARFDSFRVDDSCFIVRDERYWLYYKGRQWENTPRNTKMGLGVAETPTGPYVRQNRGRFIQDSGHEVMVWPFEGGVCSLVSNTGPQGKTLQYARDGQHFEVVGQLPDEYPKAPGAYRPDLTGLDPPEAGIEWGISMVHGSDPYLIRYEIDIDTGLLEAIRGENAHGQPRPAIKGRRP